jgi:hypothetical protein
MNHDRVVNLYDLMDSAYDAPQIHDISRQLGHVPLIDVNPRRNQALPVGRTSTGRSLSLS